MTCPTCNQPGKMLEVRQRKAGTYRRWRCMNMHTWSIVEARSGS